MPTRLTDVQFDPDVYASYVAENRPDRNAYVQSGVAVTTRMLQERAQGPGYLTSVPYWKDLDDTSENISSDDPEILASPKGTNTGNMVARICHINNGWQTPNLVSSVLGTESPMRHIASRTSAYWDQRFAYRILGMTTGLFLQNQAGSGDMIVDVSTQDGANATNANKWSFGAFVDALSTMGESDDKLAAIAVHTTTLAAMRKEQQIDFIQDAQTGIMIPTYNGKRVIVDKKMPVIAGTTSGFRYVSVLYGQGVFGYGEGTPERPVAVEYNEAAANGAGIETLWERKQWLIHPMGYRWTETTIASEPGPTVAEVALPANWAREYLRENVPLAFVVHN